MFPGVRLVFCRSLLAWVLSQGGHILPIPGIKRRRYVEGTSESNVTLTPAHPAIGLRRYRSGACRAANRTEGSQSPIEDSSTPCRGALSRSAGLSLAAATGICETATVTNLLVNGSAQKLITRREVQRLKGKLQTVIEKIDLPPDLEFDCFSNFLESCLCLFNCARWPIFHE
jgi:hypothetical protein